MVGIGRALEILQVAGYATRIGQSVIAVDMALRALQRSVCPSQGEAGRRVVKRSISP